MHSVRYRNFGSYETLVGNLSVDVGAERAGSAAMDRKGKLGSLDGSASKYHPEELVRTTDGRRPPTGPARAGGTRACRS
jgi:hypothetical protein